MRFWIRIQEIKTWIWNLDFAYNSTSFGPILLKLAEIIPYGTRTKLLDFGENAILHLDPGGRNLDLELGYYLTHRRLVRFC